MERKNYVIGFITEIIGGDKIRAEMVVQRLQDEGLLHLGYGDAEVDRVVERFGDAFGTTKISKQDRWAAHRLVNKYGGQSVVGIIDLLAAKQTEKYAPVANSVVQLEEKWPSILNFLRKNSNDEEIIKV